MPILLLFLVPVLASAILVVYFRWKQSREPENEDKIVAQQALERIPERRWFKVSVGILVTGLLFILASQGEPMPDGHSWIMAPVPWCGRVGWIVIAVGVIGTIIGLRHEQKSVDRHCQFDGYDKKECPTCSKR